MRLQRYNKIIYIYKDNVNYFNTVKFMLKLLDLFGKANKCNIFVLELKH